jgi:hypothetical protein
MPITIRWFKQPEEHDYPAAASYLGLIWKPKQVKQTVKLLRKAAMTAYKAKDIFRASRLSLLGVDNYHVEQDRRKIKRGDKLSPLLLVRDPEHGLVVIADGYHRLCAVHDIDEDATIPCKIA